MDPVTVILGATLLLLLLYKYGTQNYDHFSQRGIKSVPAVPFLGSNPSLMLKTRNFAYAMEDLCKDYKDEKIVGVIQFQKPVLMIKDPELIKRVTVKDFEYFMDHQQIELTKADTLFSKNLFTLKGERWRSMRNTLSPAFTSNKLRNMFPLIDRCGHQLVDYLEEGVKNQEPGQPYSLDMKDLFTRFTNDVIATTAFGINIDSLKEQNNEFYRFGKELTSVASWRSILFIVGLLFPKIAKIFGLTFLSAKQKDFFVNMIRESIAARENHGIVRPDMIHLLMQARKGELKPEHGEEETLVNGTVKTNKAELTEDDIAAQAMIFFFAGFETAATHLSFTAILLATNEAAQRKLQKEIDDVLVDDGELTYEKVLSMKYLDMVISESLRIFPPQLGLDRVCTKTYTIPSSGKQPAYIVNPGDVIAIPSYGIHHDPDYFPDPEKFDPERFSDENKHNIKPYTYLPFGVGPRLCIGQRLVLLEAKVAIVRILSRFNLVVVDKTHLPLTLHRDSFPLKIKGGFWVGIAPRQKLSV